jgi:hypothetical protein
MIRLDVIEDEQGHFVVSGDEPFRVEVMVGGDNPTVFVYAGAEADEDDEPLGGYDFGEENVSWSCEGDPEDEISRLREEVLRLRKVILSAADSIRVIEDDEDFDAKDLLRMADQNQVVKKILLAALPEIEDSFEE